MKEDDEWQYKKGKRKKTNQDKDGILSSLMGRKANGLVGSGRKRRSRCCAARLRDMNEKKKKEEN